MNARLKDLCKSSLFQAEEFAAFFVGHSVRPFLRFAKEFFIFLVYESWAISPKSRMLLAPFFIELGRVALDQRGPFWTMRDFEGFRMELDIAEKTQRNIFFFKLYEEGVTRFVEKTLRKGDLFVDVGANVGYYSLLAASHGARVIACEPEKGNYARLVRNVELNDFSVQSLPIAVGKEEGTLTLHINPLNHGGNSLLYSAEYWTGTHHYSREEVEKAFGTEALEQETGVESLDTLIQEPVKILKIDVEGFEAQVFEGMKEALAKGIVEHIICELGNKETRKAIIRLIKSHGYRAYSMDQSGYPVDVETGRDLLFMLDRKE